MVEGKSKQETTLKMIAIYFSETSVNFAGLHGVIPRRYNS
jgi:hypothetical protein